MTTLLSLPVEIIDQAILHAVIAGDHGAPATLGATCHALHDLVSPPHARHLWRSLFLAIFDPPALPSPPDYPYEAKYKDRVSAAAFLRTHPSRSGSRSASVDPAALDDVLRTVLDVVSSSAPLRPPILDTLGLPLPPHPVFPPLSVVSHLAPSQIPPSRNIAWLSTVLEHGFPRAVVTRLTYPPPKTSPADHSLARLVALSGALLQNVPQMAMVADPRTIVSLGGGRDVLLTPSDEPPPPLIPEPSSSTSFSALDQEQEEKERKKAKDEAEKTSDAVRRLARMRTYNMSFLSPERLFGPFLPSTSDAAIATTSTTTTPPPDAIFASDLLEDDPSDGDYVPPGAAVADDDEYTIVADTHEEPAPENLRFDWTWLAAARIVVEANLRDLLGAKHRHALRALVSLQGLRGGAAPGFDSLRAWPHLREAEDEVEDGEGGNGVGGKEEEGGAVGEEVEGWDWAGAGGLWRRCVCWLDYRDLVAHNVQSLSLRFNDSRLYEVMRIVPMTLRVRRYTRSTDPRRPTIHVEGVVVGSEATMRVWGKIDAVADGDVRWSLFTAREDNESAWQSEGVQLGAPGAAVGVLGMWTGAEHEQMDPLGPFWAWKVGSLAEATPQAQARLRPQSVQGKEPRLRESHDPS